MTESKLRKLADRLILLKSFSRYEYPDQAPPVPASVLDLIIFLTLHRELAFPSIVLTPDGNVRAQWRRGRGEHFALEFLGNDAVEYVIFAPDQKNTSGIATVDSIMQIAEPYGVLRWASAPIEEDNDAYQKPPPLTREPCPMCNGNDREMACAYPSEGKAGCLRDKRLGEDLR